MTENKASNKTSKKEVLPEPKIKIMENGPYLVTGNVPLNKDIMVCDDEGSAISWKNGGKIKTAPSYTLCRCGKSSNKPYCDGAHLKSGFTCKDVGSKDGFAKGAEKTVGSKLILQDNPEFCNHSGFCTVGIGTWDATLDSDNPKSKKIAIDQACNCPTGRLVVLDRKTKKPIEPKFEKSIGLIEEPEGEGALWVKGGIQIEGSDGSKYEKRNRVTLCRCGKSRNMPFCDGAHYE